MAQGLAIWKEDVEITETTYSINWARYLAPGTFGGKVAGAFCDEICKIYGPGEGYRAPAGFKQADMPEDAPSLKHLVGFPIEDCWVIVQDIEGSSVYFLEVC